MLFNEHLQVVKIFCCKNEIWTNLELLYFNLAATFLEIVFVLLFSINLFLVIAFYTIAVVFITTPR